LHTNYFTKPLKNILSYSLNACKLIERYKTNKKNNYTHELDSCKYKKYFSAIKIDPWILFYVPSSTWTFQLHNITIAINIKLISKFRKNDDELTNFTRRCFNYFRWLFLEINNLTIETKFFSELIFSFLMWIYLAASFHFYSLFLDIKPIIFFDKNFTIYRNLCCWRNRMSKKKMTKRIPDFIIPFLLLLKFHLVYLSMI